MKHFLSVRNFEGRNSIVKTLNPYPSLKLISDSQIPYSVSIQVRESKFNTKGSQEKMPSKYSSPRMRMDPVHTKNESKFLKQISQND
jgi:hypothetical protein